LSFDHILQTFTHGIIFQHTVKRFAEEQCAQRFTCRSAFVDSWRTTLLHSTKHHWTLHFFSYAPSSSLGRCCNASWNIGL